MKLGIVSDIHCNIQGLDRALELMSGVDQVLCLGDSIYEYRFSNEVIARLIEIDAPTIQGNHEETFLGPLGERARARLARALARRSVHAVWCLCLHRSQSSVTVSPWKP